MGDEVFVKDGTETIKETALVPEMFGVGTSSDGKGFTVYIGEVGQFAAAFNRPEILTKEWLASQLPKEKIIAHRDAMVETLARYPAEEVLRLYKKYDMAGAMVIDVEDAYSSPQAVHNCSVSTIDTAHLGKMRMARPAPIMHGSPLHTAGSPPLYGEHTEAILRELGWGDSKIDQLVTSGVCFRPKWKSKL